MLFIFFIFSSAIQASLLSTATRELNHTNITYNYTSSRSYNVKFEEEGVSYRYLTGSKSEKWRGPFPYQAFQIDSNIFFVSWFEKGYGDYVTFTLTSIIIYFMAVPFYRVKQCIFMGQILLRLSVNRPYVTCLEGKGGTLDRF